MSEHPTSATLRERLTAVWNLEPIEWGVHDIADDAINSLYACEAERDTLRQERDAFEEAHDQEHRTALRYRAFIESYIEWANDNHPMAQAARDALRGDS